MAVKPTRSTNTTLTILRSSSTPGRASSVPQAVQKAAPRSSGPAPQDGQRVPSATRQPPQNAASRSLGTRHAGQFTLNRPPCLIRPYQGRFGLSGSGFSHKSAAPVALFTESNPASGAVGGPAPDRDEPLPD